jgi:hypothetical protein
MSHAMNMRFIASDREAVELNAAVWLQDDDDEETDDDDLDEDDENEDEDDEDEDEDAEEPERWQVRA